MVTPTRQEIDEKRARLSRWIPEGEGGSATLGVNHVAVFAKDLEATAAFYTDVMRMPVINVTYNRDVEESTHMNVDVGNVMHIAISITPNRYAELKARLDSGSVSYQEAGGSLYVKDPNGLGIELLPLE